MPVAPSTTPALRFTLYRFHPGHVEKPPASEINVCYKNGLLLEGWVRARGIRRKGARLTRGLPDSPQGPRLWICVCTNPPPVTGAREEGGLMAPPSREQGLGCPRRPSSIPLERRQVCLGGRREDEHWAVLFPLHPPSFSFWAGLSPPGKGRRVASPTMNPSLHRPFKGMGPAVSLSV